MTVRSLQVVLEIKFYIPGQYLDEVCFALGNIILPLIQAADPAGIILIEKKNIPVLALMLKTRNNGAIPRLKNLLAEFLSGARIHLAIHPTLNEEFDNSFSWLATEAKRIII